MTFEEKLEKIPEIIELQKASRDNLIKRREILGLEYTEVHDAIKTADQELLLLEQNYLYVKYLNDLMDKHLNKDI